MQIKLITLCENNATFGCLAEWGLSIYVEVEGFSFLLDTGMTDVVIRNAERYAINFSALDAIVLSHGHRDHTGGLAHILKKTGPIPVYCHPDVFEPKFSARHTPPDEDISIPLDQHTYEQMGAEFRFLDSPTEMAPGILLSGAIPMNTPYEHIDEGLLSNKDGKHTNDPLHDDLSVTIKTEKGLFILFGCAHRGVVNIMEHFRHITGEQRIYGIVGGLHLSRATTEHLEKVIQYFNDIDVQKIACSHCTGFDAQAELKRIFPERFIHNNAGKRLIFN